MKSKKLYTANSLNKINLRNFGSFLGDISGIIFKAYNYTTWMREGSLGGREYIQ